MNRRENSIARAFWAVSACMIVAFVAGCAATGPNAAPEKVVFPHAPRNAPVPEENGLYVLRPGDTVAVTYFYYPRFDKIVRIRPDGYISLAPVDEVRAAGLTVRELDAALTALAAEWVENPQLSVTVTDYTSQSIYVGGEVRRSGLMMLEAGMTALQALLNAGGAMNTGDLRSVVLIRKGENGERKTFTADLAEDVETGSGDNDIYLQPFDVVYVPKSRIAKANQFVDQYIEQMLPIDLVASAGFSYVKVRDKDSTVKVGVAP